MSMKQQNINKYNQKSSRGQRIAVNGIHVSMQYAKL